MKSCCPGSRVFFFALSLGVIMHNCRAQLTISAQTRSNARGDTRTKNIPSPSGYSRENGNNSSQGSSLKGFRVSENDVKTPKECENVARNFAYQQNLCDAPDPESYTVAALGRLTCKHRCGVAPTFGRLWSECGCDELCVVYSYCCRDMASQCPHHYRKAENLREYVQEKQLIAHCSADTKVVVPEYFFNEGKSSIKPFSTTLQTSTFPPEMSSKNTNEFILKEFVSDLQYYTVADLSRGIIFRNYLHFSSTQETTDSPNFIPIGTGLTCPRMSHPRVQHVSLAQLVLWCTKTVIWRLQTSLDRDCQKHMFVGCGCGNGIFINSFQHDLCLAPNMSSQYKAEKALGYKFEDGDDKQLKRDNHCGVFKTHPKESIFDESNIEFQNIEFHITSTPVIANAPWTISTRGELKKRVKGPGSSTREDLNSVGNVQDIYDSVHFSIQSTQTLETRLICPGRNSLLSDCHLTECAPGAVLSTRPLAPWKFGGRSCEVPRLAVVSSIQHKLPVCACMRSIVALESLQLWTARIRKALESQCMIDLDILLSRATKKPKTFYTFPDDPGQLTTEPSTLDDMKDRILTSLVTTEAICDDRFNIEDIRICFYASQTEMDTVRDAIDCLHLDTESASEKHNAWTWTIVAAGLIAWISV